MNRPYVPTFSKFLSPLLCIPPLMLIWSCQGERKTINARYMPETYVTGSFVVELDPKDLAQSEALDEIKAQATTIAQSNRCSFEGIEPISWENQSGVLSTAMGQSYHLSFKGCTLDANATKSTMTAIDSIQSVASISANAVMQQVGVIENDPLKRRQYHLKAIKRDQACEAISGRDQKEVIVAVVDSGVDIEHPDLKQAILRDSTGGLVGANFVSKGARRQPDQNVSDGNGHGTHVAGLIAASSNNAIGGVGTGSCTKIKIMPIKVLDEEGVGNTLEIERGIRWASEHGADIINLSLGSTAYSDEKLQTHQRAIYEDLSQRGIIVIAAAGNSGYKNGGETNRGFRYSFPASYNHVIAVAATTDQNQLSSFSNYGEAIDIAVPGVNILSTFPNSYMQMSGTSMASPIAAGALAIGLSVLKAEQSNEAWSIKDIEQLMRQATQKNSKTLEGLVESAGVFDAEMLTLAMLGPKHHSEDDEPSIEPSPSPTAGDEAFRFVGLDPGQRLYGSIAIILTDWPEQTSRIHLYWADQGSLYAYRFGSIDYRGVSQDGQTATSLDRYYIYGQGTLVASAVDRNGRKIKSIEVGLIGL